MSTEPKFTQGPWSLDPATGGDIVWGADHSIVAQALGSTNWPVDARLLAAAPDLYEAAAALERAEDAHDNCPECDGQGVPELCPVCFPIFDDARVKRRSALAKARGEQ